MEWGIVRSVEQRLGSLLRGRGMRGRSESAIGLTMVSIYMLWEMELGLLGFLYPFLYGIYEIVNVLGSGF